MPPHPPAADDHRQAFVGTLLGDFQRQTALALRGRTAHRPTDVNSLCNAALARVLDTLYRAFDREQEGCVSFCRRVFAVAVRDELVERARKRAALKRGGGHRERPFDQVAESLEAPDDTLADLADAIEHIRRTRPVRADVVVMRAFGGFTFREIADELGVDESTARKQFKLAQAELWRIFGSGGES